MAVIFLILLFLPRSDGQIIGGDTTYYYSYLRSIAIDGNFDISNEVTLYNSKYRAPGTPEMAPDYVFSIGPALLWLPFFLLGHFIALGLNAFGAGINADGFSLFEQRFVAAGSFLYGLAGLFLTVGFLRKYFRRETAEWGMIVTFASTSIFYYLLFDPLMSHSVEIFSIGLMLFLSEKLRENDRYRWFIMGCAVGLAGIVRWQNVIFGFITAGLIIDDVIKIERLKRLVTGIKLTAMAILGFAMVFAIQSYFWKVTLDTWITIPQNATYEKQYFNIFDNHWWRVLTSLSRGWFTWHPFNLIGIIGIIIFKNKLLRLALLMVVVVDVLATGGVIDWFAPWSFGQRRLIGVTPLIMLGVCQVIEWLRERRRMMVFSAASIILVLWNCAFVVQYTLRLIPMVESPTFKQVFWDKFLLPWIVLSKF